MASKPKKDDELRRGLNWIERKDKEVPGGSITTVDKNWWSTFTASRWRSGSPRPKDDPTLRPCEAGALYVWGTNPHEHATLGQHQCAEHGTRLTHDKSQRTVEVWKLKPSKPDNDWWDGVVGAAAGADYAGGIALRDAGLNTAPSKKRKRYTAAELAKLAEARGK